MKTTSGRNNDSIGTCEACGKDNYIIKVDHLPNKELLGRKNGIEEFGGIPVDHCIGKEVEYLINKGVVTVGCCCGHRQYNPTCLIHENSVNLARDLGYNPEIYDWGTYEIKLIGSDSLRQLIELENAWDLLFTNGDLDYMKVLIILSKQEELNT